MSVALLVFRIHHPTPPDGWSVWLWHAHLLESHPFGGCSTPDARSGCLPYLRSQPRCCARAVAAASRGPQTP